MHDDDIADADRTELRDAVPGAIAPDHDCAWTRRHESEVSRRDGRIVLRGASIGVVLDAARPLGDDLARRLDEALRADTTLRLRSHPRRGLVLPSFRADDGWWRRRLARSTRIA